MRSIFATILAALRALILGIAALPFTIAKSIFGAFGGTEEDDADPQEAAKKAAAAEMKARDTRDTQDDTRRIADAISKAAAALLAGRDPSEELSRVPDNLIRWLSNINDAECRIVSKLATTMLKRIVVGDTKLMPRGLRSPARVDADLLAALDEAPPEDRRIVVRRAAQSAVRSDSATDVIRRWEARTTS